MASFKERLRYLDGTDDGRLGSRGIDTQFDEESGEGDTLAVERERDLALSARARYEVEEIDRALIKIKEGTYGICEVSGLPIPKARLQAIPQCRERVEYKVGGFSRR